MFKNSFCLFSHFFETQVPDEHSAETLHDLYKVGSKTLMIYFSLPTFHFLSCREVRVKGTREEVTQCIFHICGLLLENPPKGTVVYLESEIISYSAKILCRPGTDAIDLKTSRCLFYKSYAY
jgi:hypothetical protein